ncbi:MULTISPECIES: AraC family transcriptional regulator [unclassified Pseudomonas]|uniref:AraC-like transcriptional regulator QhpR n=1 Tax=unclassified Pseudomonas TaxID=196821 RepID=UPI000BDD7D7C|nr:MULTISPECIES: AraC family transcriptional regulator [unclassified Pseudomonas]PVZ19518.1 AraC-like DNA-binding protein [Pseudomonas sp. URIL14HWK12:I12]PVZ22897.1 AraC-like DNA-binding protein [Pseudomonas sp. URIL14HWK12:I10]PVZ37473.1 AraC-like DNA-binding protein [Pseudomonas sp. URIL14HWK12:I11]SNZ14877.1 AraC-type DNA-binding protein [Pseudomonas sp. URIL14HWK12:I9]
MLQNLAHSATSFSGTGTHQGVLAAAASGLEGFITQHGGDLDRVFGHAGIDPEQLRSPTLSLNLANYCQVMEEAARQTGCDNFGLHYGQQFQPQALGLLGYIGLCSGTLEEALVNFTQAFPLHQHNTLIELVDQGESYRFDYQVRQPGIGARRQDAELTLGMAANLMRHVLGPRWAPREVHFEHCRPADWQAHRELFDAPVHFGQACNSLVIAKHDLAGRMMPGRDPVLLMLVKDSLRQLSGLAGSPDLLAQAGDAVRHALHLGEPSLERVACQLQLGEATLQRRLREHGLCFSQLVEQVRRDLALRHLREQSLSISELAPLLGYSETSAFSRAFRRWFGVSPRQWRSIQG